MYTSKDLANLCEVSTQTIRNKVKALHYTLPLLENELEVFLRTYYPKVGTSEKGSKVSKVLNSIGKIVGKTKASGNTYYYIVKFPLGLDSEGNIVYYKHKGFTSKEEAQRTREELLRSRQVSLSTPKDNSFSHYLETLLKDMQGTLKPSTFRAYQGVLRTKIKPFFKDSAITTLDRRTLQRFVDSLDTNRHITLVVLKLALKTLYMDEILPKDYYSLLKVSRQVSSRTPNRPMTTEQLSVFFECLTGNTYEHLVRLMFATGIRVGEALALQWNDITFLSESLGVLEISKNYSETTNSLGTPKTSSSSRQVYFNDSTVVKLLKTAKELPQFKHWVAGNRQGTKPISRSYLNQYVFKKLSRVANLPFSVSSHHARLNYTSHALAQGVSEKILQEQLGHSNTILIHTVYGKPIGDRMEVLKNTQLYPQVCTPKE